MPEQRLGETAELFRAVGHAARLRILLMLRPGALCVCQVTAVLQLAASTVSAHLAELKRAGLVTERKDGRWVRYSLTPDPEGRALLERVWSLVAQDPQAESDARLVRGLRRVPVERLCRVGLDLQRLGLRPRSARSGREMSWSRR